MSFAVRPIGLYKGMRWEYVGAGALASGTDTVTVNFPTTAQAGDLAVFCGSVKYSGSRPSGWTLIASGSTQQAYKVCAGGETSTTFTSNILSGVGQILLFRPSGGAASLYDGQTDNPTANRSMSAGASPSVIVAIGNNTGSVASWSPTLPGSWSVVQNRSTSPALYVAWRLMEPGESTGTMYLGVNGRQTFGIWGIT